MSIRQLSSKKINLPKMRSARKDDIAKLTEVVQRTKFIAGLNDVEVNGLGADIHAEDVRRRFTASGMTEDDLRRTLTASMATFLLHVEARVASSLGVGFYTIGPCGEELLAAIGGVMRQTDASALHYRHVATAVRRQLEAPGRTLEGVLLDRARSYVCSTLDPVTGGKHCAIGGLPTDFLVTSTLASQASPAVGRALGVSVSHFLKGKGGASETMCTPAFPKDAVSYMSLGDGSVNNGHFLSALNLAEYAQHRGFRCPLVIGISNNNICISLKSYGWLSQFLAKYEHGPGSIRVFRCDGNDVFDVHRAAQEAFRYSRARARPSIVVYDGIVRRFGHAATDRQTAYYTSAEVAARAEHDSLLAACRDAVALGVVSAAELRTEAENLTDLIEKSFDTCVNEPKITDNATLVQSNSRPLIPSPGPASGAPAGRSLSPAPVEGSAKGTSKRAERLESMRKQMTRVFDEILGSQTDTVYIGEDVEHGGYYLVTEGLAAKYPHRVCDFPPDETSLLGVGMGYAHAGMTPIVEIPYAKYLDCAADMFFEAVIMNWLSDGAQPNGMLLRLQGFDKGVFGGNFHTHNTLHVPAGLDVVCYSNGFDYARGMRYCMRQARGGRVVMSVDSTDLLNRRHVDTKDDGCLSRYPSVEEAELSFDDVMIYSTAGEGANALAEIRSGARKVRCVIVTYGNGVPTSLMAVKQMVAEEGAGLGADEVLVVDCPYLSALPGQLSELCGVLRESGSDFSLLLADVCKESGNMPLHQYVLTLQRARLLPPRWGIVGAANTYNPLSRTLTFLNEDGIKTAVRDMLL